MTEITYEKILQDPYIQKIYKDCDVLTHEHHAIHGWVHVLNTVETAKRLFNAVGFSEDIKNAVLIALALHDIGKLYINGEKQPDHHKRGYDLAKKYLEKYQFPYKDDALTAILEHDKDSKKSNLIGDIVCFCDKLDITYKRITEKGKTAPRVRQIQYIKEVRYNLTKDTFEVIFVHSKEFNRSEWLEDYFPPKVWASIVNLACCLGKNIVITFRQL